MTDVQSAQCEDCGRTETALDREFGAFNQEPRVLCAACAPRAFDPEDNGA